MSDEKTNKDHFYAWFDEKVDGTESLTGDNGSLLAVASTRSGEEMDTFVNVHARQQAVTVSPGLSDIDIIRTITEDVVRSFCRQSHLRVGGASFEFDVPGDTGDNSVRVSVSYDDGLMVALAYRSGGKIGKSVRRIMRNWLKQYAKVAKADADADAKAKTEVEVEGGGEPVPASTTPPIWR